MLLKPDVVVALSTSPLTEVMQPCADLPFEESLMKHEEAQEHQGRRTWSSDQEGRRSEPGPAPGPSAPQKQLLLKGFKPAVAVLKFASSRRCCHADGGQPERLLSNPAELQVWRGDQPRGTSSAGRRRSHLSGDPTVPKINAGEKRRRGGGVALIRSLSEAAGDESCVYQSDSPCAA